MIKRAIERGVSRERLAKALCIDVGHMMRKANLLEGICSEASDLLQDRQFSADISRVLRKMKPTRQVECVELMVSANNITMSYAEALLVATPAEMLIDGKKPQKLQGITQEQMLRMEREMSSLQGQYKMVEQNYGQDMLNLVLARGGLSMPQFQNCPGSVAWHSILKLNCCSNYHGALSRLRPGFKNHAQSN